MSNRLDIALLAILTITALTLGGGFTLNDYGHDLPGQTEHTFIDDPTLSQPTDATIANYENDLTSDERTTFRAADSNPTGTDGTINADYVELDGEYYHVYTDTTYTGYTQHAFNALGGLGFFISTVGGGLALILTILAILATGYESILLRIGPRVASAITITLGLALLTALLLNPFTATAVLISTGPVDNPDLDNATTTHLTELSGDDNADARTAMTSSIPAPHDDLDYNTAAHITQTDNLEEIDYIHTDGEHYHVTTESRIDPYATIIYPLIILLVTSGLPFFHYLVYDELTDD